MDRDLYKAAVAQLLLRYSQETGENYPSHEQIQTPLCRLDLESYELLVERTGRTGYPKVFNKAIRAMKTVVTADQLHQVMALVKNKRSGSSSHSVRTKMVKTEWEWAEQMATALRTKPIRILEAALFLYLRADEKNSVDQ